MNNRQSAPRKRCWVIFYLIVFICVSYASIGQSSKSKPSKLSATKFTITDSSLRYWIRVAPGPENFSSDQFAADSSGNIYCRIYNSERFLIDGFQILKLVNGKWESFHPAAEKIMMKATFHYDGYGGLFLRTENHLFQLKNKTWQPVFKKDSLHKSVPTPEIDKNFYAAVDEKLDDRWVTRIVKCEKNKYLEIGPGGKPLYLQSTLDKYKVDKNGTVYAYRRYISAVSGPVEIKKWDGDGWQLIGTAPESIFHFEFDHNNNLYVAGFGNDNKRYFKKWDGQTWSDMPNPGGKDMPSPEFDVFQNVFCMTITTKGNFLYKFVKDKWEEIAKEGYDLNFSTLNYIPTQGRIYAYGYVPASGVPNEIFYYEPAGKTVVNHMEVDKVPLEVSSGKLFGNNYEAINNHFLFEKDGKLGIQDRKGYVKILPLFDKIVVKNTPDHLLTVGFDEALRRQDDNAYCLELTSAGETIHVNLYDVINWYGSHRLMLYKEKTIRLNCSQCKGNGKSQDKKRTIETKEWVPGEKYYVKTLTVNGWKPEIITYPGYYKTISKETEITPGETCGSCSGKGYLAVFSKQQYNYDEKKKKYVLNWIN